MHIHGSNFLYYFIGIEHAINAYQTIKPHEKKNLQENTNHMNFEKYEHEKFSSIIQI